MTRLYPLLPWALCVLGAVCCLSACDAPKYLEVDRCMQREMFRECMASLPVGPVRAHYNDWSEVVSECRDYALYSSYREARLITEECR